MSNIADWLGDDTPLFPDFNLLDLPDFSNTSSHAPAGAAELSGLRNDSLLNAFSPISYADLLSDDAPQDAILDMIDVRPSPYLEESFDSSPHDSIPQSSAEASDESERATTGKRCKGRQRKATDPPSKSCMKRKRHLHEDQGRRSKLSTHATEILEKFFAANEYPEAADFAHLAEHTGVGTKQIRTWFNNKRFRQPKTGADKAEHTLQSGSQHQEESFARGLTNLPEADPKLLLERYLDMPLDQDPQMRFVIAQASENVEGYFDNASESSCGSFSSHDSTASWSFRRGRARTRQPSRVSQRQRYEPERETNKFRCTFCGLGLKDAYQWRRHEDSNHAPRNGWICKHIECAGRPLEDKIFFREDLFKQHVCRHAEHGSADVELVKANPIPKGHPALWCGFCGDELPSWDDRVRHIGAHFAEGANLSRWWLKRAAANTPKLETDSWSLHYTRAVLYSSVFCVYCGSLYLSMKEAESLHPECNMWSCAWFEGVQAAFAEHWPLSSCACLYCGDTIFEDGLDCTNRLSHLIREHKYRACHPRLFSNFTDFHDHMGLFHNSTMYYELEALGPTVGRELEGACQRKRKSEFKSAADGFVGREGPVGPPSQQISPDFLLRYVDILARGRRKDIRDIFSTKAFFAPSSPFNVVDRRIVEYLSLRTHQKSSYRGRRAIADAFGGEFPVIGEVVLQWLGPWESQCQHPSSPSEPVLHKSKFLVVDAVPFTPPVLGRGVVESLGMV